MAHADQKLAIFRGLLRFKSNVQKIWGVLIFLSIVTTIEVVLGIIKPESLMNMVFGMKILNWIFIILTIVKAHYIAWDFMHIRDERSGLKNAIVLPLVILIPYLAFILLLEADYIFDGIPLINPMHIQEGKLKPNPNYTISKLKRDSLPNYILQDGDVIMGRRGEMGRSALISKKETGWFCGTGSLYLRPNLSLISPNYLNKYIQSSTVKALLTGSAAGTTMMNLNKKIISTLPIPIPTLKEQYKIVLEIESRLSVCDKVEESIVQSLEKAQALKQSILKKAFEGKLLSTAEITKCKADAAYEPASVLLEKIKAEKKQK